MAIFAYPMIDHLTALTGLLAENYNLFFIENNLLTIIKIKKSKSCVIY